MFSSDQQLVVGIAASLDRDTFLSLGITGTATPPLSMFRGQRYGLAAMCSCAITALVNSACRRVAGHGATCSGGRAATLGVGLRTASPGIYHCQARSSSRFVSALPDIRLLLLNALPCCYVATALPDGRPVALEAALSSATAQLSLPPASAASTTGVGTSEAAVVPPELPPPMLRSIVTRRLCHSALTIPGAIVPPIDRLVACACRHRLSPGAAAHSAAPADRGPEQHGKVAASANFTNAPLSASEKALLDDTFEWMGLVACARECYPSVWTCSR